jgi:hypothetical protein
VVHGRTNSDGTACFWIEYRAKPGTPAGRVAIVWPHGSRAYAHPLRVVGVKGDVLATVGRPVSLGGGVLDADHLPVTGCPDATQAFG